MYPPIGLGCQEYFVGELAVAIKTYLTSDEIQQMIDSAQYLRDKVILTFYGDTGVRVSELLKIKVEDLDLDHCVVMIPHLKRGIKKHCPKCSRMAGRNTHFCSKCGCDLSGVEAEGIEERNRLINIGEGTAEILREWISELKPSDNVISLSRQRIYVIVREAAERIGLRGRVILNPETGKKHYPHPSNFRDSLAVDWLTTAGSDVRKQKALQEQLGYLNFETTIRLGLPAAGKLTLAKVKDVSEEVRQARFGNPGKR